MKIEEAIRDRVKPFMNPDNKFMGHALGIEFQSLSRKEVTATMPVNENTVQPMRILHGGASVALAETLTSIGAYLNIDNESQTAVGLEINANHIRSVPEGGKVTGRAKPLHIGRKTQIWQSEIRNEAGKLVSISRCTIAIVDKS